MPMNRGYPSSQDALLLQQGKIKTSDKKIYIAGNIETTNTMKISIGSPIGATTESYSIIPEGVICYPSDTSNISYKTLYCRFLATGSLSGEQ